MANLEPVNGTAVYEGGEHSNPIAEVISDRTEGQHHVEVTSDSLDEHVVHV